MIAQANTTQYGIVVTGVSSDIILIGIFIFAFTMPIIFQKT